MTASGHRDARTASVEPVRAVYAPVVIPELLPDLDDESRILPPELYRNHRDHCCGISMSCL
jgi:hypothetical protein